MADKVTSKKYVGKKRLQRAKSVKIRTETKGFGFFKTALVLFFIALNFAVLLYFYLQFMMLFRYYLAVAFVLSLLTAVYVLSTDKNGQSKAVWIIIVLLGFTFGYFLYFLADENVFFSGRKESLSTFFRSPKNTSAQATKPTPAPRCAITAVIYTARAVSAHIRARI